MSTFKQLQAVIATTLKVPPDSISESTTSEEIAAWDSLGHVNLMIALEQSYDILFDVEDFSKLTSVPAIIQYLRDQDIE